MSHPSFSIPLFSQLVRRLRQTNARYNQIAFQCRRTQRSTYHAKRRAYRVGLRIDTSKARAAWPDDHVSVASPVLDRTAGSPTWAATETETEEDPDARLPNPWPELEHLPEVVVPKQPATQSLSPLGLGLINVDDMLPLRGPVPGAPRWRSRPLPEDVCEIQAMITESVSACTYDPAWRSVIATRVSVSMPLDVVYDGLGIAVPSRHLKRKLRDVDADGGVGVSRRRVVGVSDDGAWQSEAQSCL